ncbi:MAG TPA: diacylglycerol kinase family protein [Thermoanaerobaculia bacterium]|nr:diacylglycerol kinase family protein [Thermoanaerobaculia bacterium]
MRLKLLYNPAAGRGRARRRVEEIERYLRSRGSQLDVHASTSPADLTRAAADGSRADYDRVVVCGGDGTIHFAVRDFDLERGVMAIIPLGSGDDFAQVAGIPRNLHAACDVVLDGKLREVDVATANGIRYLGVAGLGFDSEVAAFANRVKFLGGSLVYLYSIFRVLPRFTPRRVRVGTREEEIMFAVVGNSRQYGGGIRIVPAAQIDDGILDLCMVHRTSRFQLLITLPLAYTGAHVRKSFVETGRGREFRFESDQPLDVYADGEFVTTTPVTFGLEKRKLRVAAHFSAPTAC